MHEWEELGSSIQRLAVPNGWIYKINELSLDGRNHSESHVFVPDAINKPRSEEPVEASAKEIPFNPVEPEPLEKSDQVGKLLIECRSPTCAVRGAMYTRYGLHICDDCGAEVRFIGRASET